jgi:hypothetical protein
MPLYTLIQCLGIAKILSFRHEAVAPRSVVNSRAMITVVERRNIFHWCIDRLRLNYEEPADSAHTVRIARNLQTTHTQFELRGTCRQRAHTVLTARNLQTARTQFELRGTCRQRTHSSNCEELADSAHTVRIARNLQTARTQFELRGTCRQRAHSSNCLLQ